MMEIQHEQTNGIWLVNMRGRFDAPSAPEAERKLRTLLEEGMNRVVLDLSDVEYISSGGLRVIIMLTKALERVSGEMKLCGLSPFVSEVFKITNLAKRYDICASREEAVSAFAPTS
jgi:anti-anti-sigma factor